MYMASARVWWMFRLFGHDNVYVLDKGVRPESQSVFHGLLESGPCTIPDKGNFKAHFRRELVKTLPEILENLSTRSFQVVDARSADRFYARVDEPRPGVVRGHMPNSFNVPFDKVLLDRSFLPTECLKQIFTDAGVDLNKPIVTTCGSGVTAAVLSLALSLIGVESAIYDGSWAEYGQQSLNLPVERS
eukprot:TRINITY_DN4862_c0_g1_i6.p1 TRINITY_DN4862_c0_g1~~TRINITY_DN4862_c0_g1_i6.p1  ORF type:complete len:188 (-),score=36.07 TRINITY_DN4862_c0_g1_i6:237-800(-)